MAKFNDEMIQQCSDWVRENGLMDYGGAKLKDFCKHFGIDAQTYYNWMENSDFSNAIKKAKDGFKNGLERRIVSSMANAAIGYEYEQTLKEYYMDGKKKKLKKEVKKNIRVEPNVGAGIFLLTNLAPDRWKNKQNTEHSGEISTNCDEIKYDITVIPDELLFAVADKLQTAEFEKIAENKAKV